MKLVSLREEVSSLKNLLGSPQAVVLESAHTKEFICRFLALLEGGHTVFPVPSWLFHDISFREKLQNDSGTDFSFWALKDVLPGEKKGHRVHPELKKALNEKKARFIVKTSGSSGKFKLVLHDPVLFQEKYQRIGKHFEKTLWFFPADSIAGIETLLEVWTHEAELILPTGKLGPALVLKNLNDFSVDYFHTTPSFLNLMVVGGVFKSSAPDALKIIAFGSEPSQEKILNIIHGAWKDVQLLQSYGMSEIGIQKTLPCDHPSEFRLDEKFNLARVREGLLEIKSLTPMICYLNFGSQMTDDGWFSTMDRCRKTGECYQVEGRESDLININGLKFFPSEVEDLLLRVSGVLDVTVKSEFNDLVGKILIATILISCKTEEGHVRVHLKEHMEKYVPQHMRPQRIIIVTGMPETERLKKMRTQ